VLVTEATPPAATRKALLAAGVKSVVACATRPICAGATPAFCSTARVPIMAPRAGSSGVVLSLQITARPSRGSSTTTSVKVPPISMPRESILTPP
jgi:hypothetical protein